MGHFGGMVEKGKDRFMMGGVVIHLCTMNTVELFLFNLKEDSS